jgi:hypothetical protein
MNLKVWEEETFELLLNNGRFQITDCGPLCSPINNFEIKRDGKQRLLLTTRSDENSKKDTLKFPELPAGTVHSNIACATLSSSDMTVVANGVMPFDQLSRQNPATRTYEKTEKAWVHSLEAIPSDVEQVHQLIEWVDNVDTAFYHWPHNLEEKLETVAIRTLSGGAEPLTQRSQERTLSLRGCLWLNIAGHEIYIAPFQNHKRERPSGPGFILYKKFPCEDIRRKIRECLSFVFGLPLVYLGYTLLSEDFKLVGFEAVTPYIIDERAYSLPALPPAPVGRKYANLIDPNVFSRTVNSLFLHYDELNFRHVSWIYLHAVCSPMHTQPVQFGAGIEALQTAYGKLNKPQYKTKLLDKQNAEHLREEFLKIVDSIIPEDTKEKDARNALINKASGLNNPSQDTQNERFFASLSLDMGDKEKNAWQRRNNAAHGNTTKPDDSVELIRDIHLLKNIFHRIVISMAEASNQYIDCYSPKFPIRQLRESVDAKDRFFFEG